MLALRGTLTTTEQDELQNLLNVLAKVLNHSGIANAGTTDIAPLVASSALTGESAPE